MSRWRTTIAGVLILSAPLLAEAAIFGVPTNLNANGTTSSSTQNPPGWFQLDGTAVGSASGGDAVHQMKFFIEVTSSTLDIRIFDAGTSGARDLGGSSATTTVYALRDPNGNVIRSSSLGDDDSTTENRLVRFSSSGGAFTAANGGQMFTGLNPGVYEFRVTASGGNETNAFGLEIRDGSGNPYNAYTTASSDSDLGAPGASETALIVASLNGGSPPANITDPMFFYPYVNRGCSIQTSNFDMDSSTSPGAGSSATVTDALGVNTGLTMSGATDHDEDTVTVATTTATNLRVVDYGLYSLSNDPGSSQNAIDWRVADFSGWSNNPGSLPRNPASPIRIYLPSAYSISGSSVTPTAPVEPVLGTSAMVVSGPNPPLAGQTTRFLITTTIYNPTGSPLTNAQITIGQPANVTYVSGTQAGFIDGASSACTDGSGATFRRCTFASVPSGSVASLNIEVDFSPTTSGLQVLTGAPASGSPPPDTTVWAQYTPAFSSSTFPRTEVLGPACQLTVDVGGLALATRATLKGLRVDPAGVVEFATGSQTSSAAFNVYGVAGAGVVPRTLLNSASVPARDADSLTPVLYRVQTSSIVWPYLLIEEVDLRGRRHFMGPFSVTDSRLRSAFDRLDSQLHGPVAASPGVRKPVPTSRLSRRQPVDPSATETARRGEGVKIEVLRAGHVQVSLAELHAQGLPVGLPSRALRLTTQGRDVPFEWIQGPGGLEAIAFVGEVLSTDYTGRNVYVLTWKRGRARLAVALSWSGDPEASGFVRIEKSRIYVPSAPQGTDPWVWDLLLGDGSAWPYEWDPDAGNFDLPGLSPGTAGSEDPAVVVRVRVVGRTLHHHVVEASINGVPAGSLELDGAVPGLLEGSVPASVLRPYGNKLSLRYASNPEDPGLLYLGQLDIAAPVDMAGVAGELGRIEPFDPAVPRAGPDYLIVTHPLFRDAAEKVAAFKQREGHRVAVVDVDRAYDRYSAGIVEANAISALVREVRRGGGLRYVLLVGDDSFDPRNFSALGVPSYIPSLYGWDGEFGRVPSENRYADVDGDGAPDVAIGRLPAGTVEEADALAEKVGRQQAVLRALGKRQLFAVDNQAPGDASFRTSAEAVLPLLPAGSTVKWADIGQGTDAARQSLFEGLQQGVAVTHYFGHGGPEQWSDEALLVEDEVDSLAGRIQDTVLFTWACESQYYSYLFGHSLNEGLLLLPQGGALAAFGGAGITTPAMQAELYRRLYRGVWAGRLSLGEAIRRAKSQALAADPRTRGVVEGFNLLGDPALVLADAPGESANPAVSKAAAKQAGGTK